MDDPGINLSKIRESYESWRVDLDISDDDWDLLDKDLDSILQSKVEEKSQACI